MTTKLIGSTGIEFPDSTVQETAGSSSGSVDPRQTPIAWCTFDGTVVGTNPPISGFNVASVERLSAGRYRIRTSRPLVDLLIGIWVSLSSAGPAVLAFQGGATMDYIEVYSYNSGSTIAQDNARISVVIYGENQ